MGRITNQLMALQHRVDAAEEEYGSDPDKIQIFEES